MKVVKGFNFILKFVCVCVGNLCSIYQRNNDKRTVDELKKIRQLVGRLKECTALLQKSMLITNI